MKITAPISKIEEVEPLVAAGADELYCGVVPPNWITQFNTGAVNRRYFGNLGDYAQLGQGVELAHRGGARLFMVLNAQHYGEHHHGALLEIAAKFQDYGGDAVIVADLALITLIREKLPELAVHVSSVANCRNSQAVGFLADLGVKRVILPRDVTLDEIARIRRNQPQVEIEAFVLNDGCVFEEGLCHTVHLPAKLGGPICTDSFGMGYQASGGEPVSLRVARKLAENDQDYQRWLWYRFGCGFSTTEEGFPYGPCGLCAIHRLHAAGVASAKVAGREGATARKLKSVEMVRRVVDGVLAGQEEADAAALAVGIRNTPAHCSSGYMCYYPEVRWKGDYRPEATLY